MPVYIITLSMIINQWCVHVISVHSSPLIPSLMLYINKSYIKETLVSSHALIKYMYVLGQLNFELRSLSPTLPQFTGP